MNTKKIQKNKGFSMVELIVVLSIFAIMTGTSIFNYNEYRTAIERTNLTQDVALTIRQAQVYGITATEKKVGSINFDAEEEFDVDNNRIVDIVSDKSTRGVSFDIGRNEITLFADTQGPSHPNIFMNTGSSADRVIDKRNILYRDVGFEYACLCNASSCDYKTAGTVDLAFKRPYTDATINYRSATGFNAAPTNYSRIILVISSASDTLHNEYIEINSIGNIAVKSNYDPTINACN